MKGILSAAIAAWACLVPALAESEAKWIESDVTIPGGGDVTLHGSLITMGAWKPEFDAVLFLSGSGPTDRDGNQPGFMNNDLKLVADALAEEGIASLRVDKRGVGASMVRGMKEEDLRFDMYVDDARSWCAFLKSQPHVKRVFLIGHSEGALIGAIAAEDGGFARYLSLEGASLAAAVALRRQIKDGANGERLAALAEPTLAKLEKGELDPSPAPELAFFFRASIQPYLISYFKYDPVVEVTKLQTPILIVQGSHDLQVTVEDGERLRAARPDATYALIPDMNHPLRVAPEDRAGNLAIYNRTDLPLAPGLMDALLAFLKAP